MGHETPLCLYISLAVIVLAIVDRHIHTPQNLQFFCLPGEAAHAKIETPFFPIFLKRDILSE